MGNDMADQGIIDALMGYVRGMPFGLGIPQGNISNAQGQTVFPTNPLERMLQGSDDPTKQLATSFIGPGAKGLPTFSSNKGRFVNGVYQSLVDSQAREWLQNAGAVRRQASVVKDVTLANGQVLPNRRLSNEVWDLPDGRTVELRGQGPSSNPASPTSNQVSIVEAAPHFWKKKE